MNVKQQMSTKMSGFCSRVDILISLTFILYLIDDADEDDSDGAVGNGGEDSDDGRDYSWKKTIMIGPSYQASVPGGLSAYGDTLPYGNIFSSDNQLRNYLCI